MSDVTTQNLLSELAAIIGGENVSQAVGDRVDTLAAWRQQAVAVVAPGTAAEVSAAVRTAEVANLSLVPCGGGTHLHTGYPPRSDRPFLLLHTARLNRLQDYQPDDMTVTCEPGMTLAALQQALAAHRQFLPIDVPLPARTTLGGIVSTNASGFWRPAYGTPRDLLIGLRAVMTGGEGIKGGGKVVKNVAGYDVCKLFTGAWGTLGVLTELTFKVRPLPELQAVFAWDMPDLATAARIGLDLHHARLAATCLLATNESEGTPRLLLGLHGTAARVDWQAVEFGRRVAAAGISTPVRMLEEAETGALLDRQARLGTDTPLAARIACLPTDLPPLIQALAELPSCSLTAHCATGIVHLATEETDIALIDSVNALQPAQANFVWTRLDASLADREDIALWGEKPEAFFLQEAIKRSLDPRNTFSPGRFLGRI